MNSIPRTFLAALLLAGGGGLLGRGLYRILLPPAEPVFARIKLEREVAGAPRAGAPRPTSGPEFIRTEIEFMRSELVLRKVVEALDLTRQWNDRNGGGSPLGTNDALQRLRQVVELFPVKKSALVDIRVRSVTPAEAASIANAVAETYRAYHREQCERTRQSIAETVSNSVESLEAQWRILGRQIREAQEQLNAATTRVASESLTRLLSASETALPEEPAVAADPAKVQARYDLQRRLAELQQARSELEKNFISDTHDVPAASCVNVDVIRPAAAPLPGRPAPQLRREAGLAAAGLFLCAGAGWLLKKPRRAAAARPARRDP